MDQVELIRGPTWANSVDVPLFGEGVAAWKASLPDLGPRLLHDGVCWRRDVEAYAWLFGRPRSLGGRPDAFRALAGLDLEGYQSGRASEAVGMVREVQWCEVHDGVAQPNASKSAVHAYHEGDGAHVVPVGRNSTDSLDS